MKKPMTQKQFDDFKHQCLTGKELFDKLLLADPNLVWQVKFRANQLGKDKYGNDVFMRLCSCAGMTYLKYREKRNGKYHFYSEKKAFPICREVLCDLPAGSHISLFDLYRVYDIIESYFINYNQK